MEQQLDTIHCYEKAHLNSKRLQLYFFQASDAVEVFHAITPTLTRYMSWDPPASEQDFAQIWQNWLLNMLQQKEYIFVIRHAESQEFLGLCGLHKLKEVHAEVGIWIKEDAHGHGYGLEAIQCLVNYAFAQFNLSLLRYPVAEANWASRRIAESLAGKVIEYYTQPKYQAVLYHLYPTQSLA